MRFRWTLARKSRRAILKPKIVSKSLFTDGETSAQLKFEVIIDENGDVSEPKLVESCGNPAIDQVAEEHVLTFKFEPGKTAAGKPGRPVRGNHRLRSRRAQQCGGRNGRKARSRS